MTMTTLKKPVVIAPVGESESENGSPGRLPALSKRTGRLLATALAVIAVGAFAIYRMAHLTTHEETDDAYVTGHPHQVSARIENLVESVLVDDNDHVEKGQLLVKLDPHDYEVQLARAEAKLNEAIREAQKDNIEIRFADQSAGAETAQAEAVISAAQATIEHKRSQLNEASNEIEVAKAQLEEANAQLKRSKLDYERFTRLESTGVVSTQQKDKAVEDYEVCKSSNVAKEKMVQEAVARYKEAESALEESKARLKEAQGRSEKAQSAHVFTEVTAGKYRMAQAAVAEAQSEVNAAKLQLSYCYIQAPVSGRIGKRTVEVGHRIDAGQQLLDVVEDYVWVVANFKETQLRHMKPGLVASIKVDSIPDRTFTGVVDSFSPGSGASFALLPPDNATGNFTKIVQRVPVKIRFLDSTLEGLKDRAAVGLSATVSIDMHKEVGAAELNRLRKLDAPQEKSWSAESASLR